MRAPRKPRHYFCFRSPYSWMAFRHLRRTLTEAEWSSIELLPFWEPDEVTLAALTSRGGQFLYHTMSREKHLYILQDVKRLAAGFGLKHVWPIDQQPWWELPNLVYLAAAAQGRGLAFAEAAFKARWEDGLNIHESATLEALCADIGLDPSLAREAPSQPQVREQAVDIAQRWQKDGLFGVPFFVVGFQKFWGVDRMAAFVQTLRGEPPTLFGQPETRHSPPTDAAETPPPQAVAAVWDDALSPLWKGVPPSVVDKVGALDGDSAGGCG